ncbi:MAG: C4-dicarboxylate ABC transporter substrate-binding protein [Gammaproteobacteria bacterium]|nr:MAG: C4-dicarboxylate ABC transporter substrate-binding protein [Gammaproteobacteria bacterium]
MSLSFRTPLPGTLLVLATLLLSACDGGSATRVLRLAHALDTGHPVHKAMVHMAERVAELSGGRLRVMIYPNGQLGAERELIELLQIGSLAMTKVSSSPLESFAPRMQVFSIPYVFRDQDHYWKVLEGPIGRALLEELTPYRVRGLCYYDAGSRSFYTTRVPVRRPEDLKGLKIRVQKSRTSIAMVNALGAAATPIAWGELYTALQQGVVDGAENNPPSLYISRQYEVIRYYTLNEHTAVPDVLLISTRVWDALSPQERAWLEQAVAESVDYQRRLWAEFTEHALAKIAAAGVEIIHPDKAPFRAAVADFHAGFRGTPTGELLEAIDRVR